MKRLETLSLGNLYPKFRRSYPNKFYITLQIMSKTFQINETKQRERNTFDNLQLLLNSEKSQLLNCCWINMHAWLFRKNPDI